WLVRRDEGERSHPDRRGAANARRPCDRARARNHRAGHEGGEMNGTAQTILTPKALNLKAQGRAAPPGCGNQPRRLYPERVTQTASARLIQPLRGSGRTALGQPRVRCATLGFG